MKRLYIFAATLIAATVYVSKASADKGWINITEERIVNPSFDGDSNAGWTYTSNASSQTVRCGAMEFWNGTFDIFQTVSNLPAGHYRMSVQAYHRCQDNNSGYWNYASGNEDITAMMYANNTTQKLASIYSFYFTTPPAASGVWSTTVNGKTVYFPNTMETATEAFSQGAYNNELEFDHTGGDLKLGLVNQTFVNNNWCIFDNFKLELYGEIIAADGISLNTYSTTLVTGETLQLVATISPANATFKKITWRSDNESVATVDGNGLVKTKKPGTAKIYASTTDGSTVMAACTVKVEDNTATAESLVINEIMASNVDEFVSPAFQFDGWIELYNPTSRPVTISGLWLSNDPMNTKMWKISAENGAVPAKGYKVIWCDNNNLCPTNANMKLDVDGGQIIISDGNGNIITSESYPASMERIAYARITDGGNEWANTDTPTPGKSNNNAIFGAAQLNAPIVAPGSQVFKSSMRITVEIPDGATLRYTTDGTLPTATNGNTSKTGVFNINNTANYRFRLFADGMMASPVTTRSYIKWDKDFNIPVLSVVSDPRFLYDDSLGVYVRGVNGKPGNGQSSPCNWNMDWERPVNMSYINDKGEMVLNQDVNLEMCGGWSRAWTPHSFKLKGNKELGGDKNLNYPFFEAKPYIKNRTLQVRNGGNDNSCRFKDPALETIIQTSGIDIDLQSYQPVHEFINGEYIGVLNVREPNNKHYVYANYGWDDDQIDQFEMSPDSGYVQKQGTIDSFLKWYDYSADAANNDTYEEIKQMVDIDEYTNYMAATMYLGGTDWPQNNIKGFRLTEDGKFRFVSFDLDFAFNTSDPFNTFEWKNTYTFDKLHNGLPQITAEIKFVTIFLNMLQNAEFRKKFIDTYCIMGGSVFEPTRCNQILDSLVNKVAPEMAFKGESPYSTYNSIKEGLANRMPTMINSLKNYWRMQLNGKTAVSGKLSSDIKGARIELNGTDIPTGKFDGQLFSPMTITAVAPAGYKFTGWKSNNQLMTTVVGKGSSWKYYDQGSLDGKNWTANSYNENSWKQGYAPLGYGKDGLATTISYGSSSSDKYPTYYFRQSFNLDEKPSTAKKAVLNFTVDDGFIVYINGQEAGRYNMPAGAVNFQTVSTTYAHGNPDTGTLEISTEAMRKGTNVIAVEVHNNSRTSSDIYWDAELKGMFTTNGGNDDNYIYNEETITMPSESFDLMACYEPMENPIEEGFAPVRINEISAANDIYVNEYGKKNDWIELYNTTDEPIDVEGMFLSNDANNLRLFTLTKGETSASTIIPAKGYMVVWCDKLETSHDLHTPFKLAAAGGTIALTAADGTWTDSICYPAHDGYSTIGRYADGAQSVYHLTTPTIGKPNVMTSYANKIAEQTSGITNLTASAGNRNITLRMAAGNFVVRTEAASAKIELYTLSGQKISETTVNIVGGIGTHNIETLPHGCYIAKATDSNGMTATMKVRK